MKILNPLNLLPVWKYPEEQIKNICVRHLLQDLLGKSVIEIYEKIL